jgi:hypothetical protein
MRARQPQFLAQHERQYFTTTSSVMHPTGMESRYVDSTVQTQIVGLGVAGASLEAVQFDCVQMLTPSAQKRFCQLAVGSSRRTN